MFCYPISDHVIFSREFYFCFVIKYAHKSKWTHMHWTKFERNSSLGGTIIPWSEVGKQNIQSTVHWASFCLLGNIFPVILLCSRHTHW